MDKLLDVVFWLAIGVAVGAAIENHNTDKWTANAAKPEAAIQAGEGVYKVLTLTDYLTRCGVIRWEVETDEE